MTGFTLSTSAVPYLHHATTTTRVRHGFFGAAGGVSSGVYASLNCGFGSGDDTALVAQNRDLVRTEMGLEPGRMAAVHQVHGRDAVMAEDLFDDTGALLERDSLPRADGLVTRTAGIGLSILTADCLPLLLADEQGLVAGACHAGWRGAAAGIVGATVALMRDRGAGRITALIGPTIQQPSYQVGGDMRAQCLDSVAAPIRDLAASCFIIEGQDHYRFDLPRLVRYQLASEDVAQVLDCGVDTYQAPARDGAGPAGTAPESGGYFSHRRATHAREPDCGRQIAVIALTG